MGEFLTVLAGLCNIILASIVFYKQRNNKAAQWFFIFGISAMTWIASNVLWRVTAEYDWVKLTYTTGLLFGVTGLLWSHSLSVVKKPAWYGAVYSIAIVLGLLSLVDNMIVKDFIPGTITGYEGLKKGPLFDVYSIYMFGLFVLILFRLYQAYRFNTGLERLQRKFVFWGGVVYLITLLIIDFVIPSLLNDFTLTAYDSPATLILIGSTAYATLRYRFMDVQLILRTSFVYSVLALCFFGLFYLLAWFFTTFLGGVWNIASFFTGVVLCISFAVLLPRIEHAAIYVANTYFYANIYNAREAFETLTKTIASRTDLLVLGTTVVRKIRLTFKVKKVFLVITKQSAADSESKKYRTFNARKVVKFLPVLHMIKNAARAEDLADKPLVYTKDFEHFCRKENVKVVIPLIHKEKHIGFIFVGPKQADRIFTKEDLLLLDTFAKQGAIAFDNAFLYGDLKEKNTHFKRLLSEKSEFLDIASHQLRSPISIIRSAAELITRSSGKSVISFDDALQKMYDATIRLNNLVDDLLLASKLDSPHFSLSLDTFRTISVLELVSSILETMSYRLRACNVKVSIDIGKEAVIFGYDKYVSIVLENLIDNAVKYSYNTGEPCIEIHARVLGNVVRISVSDNGVGISKNDRQRIFQKFMRTKTAQKHVPEGTGLGLYIVRRVTEAHPYGRWGFKSVLQKGSEFWVEFQRGNVDPVVSKRRG